MRHARVRVAFPPFREIHSQGPPTVSPPENIILGRIITGGIAERGQHFFTEAPPSAFKYCGHNKRRQDI